MYLIKAGVLETKDSFTLTEKRKSQDFEKAKKKADKLLKTFEQVKVIDFKTSECFYFQSSIIK